MWANLDGSLFGDLNNIVEYTNEEIEVPNFYLDKDALDCLCHCVSNLDITNGLLDLNEVIDLEDECKHGGCHEMSHSNDFKPIQSLLPWSNLVVTEIL